MPTLFEKSGAEGQYRRFKFEIARIAEKDPLPGYTLLLEQPAGKREPSLRMIRRAEPKTAGGRKPLSFLEEAGVAPVQKSAPSSPSPTPPLARVSAEAAEPSGPDAKRFPGETPSPERTAELSHAAAIIRRSIKGLATRATAGDLTDATLATLHAECPGWDYQTLHEEFRRWLAADQARTPVNYQNAFIGFVKRWDAKHRYQLGR